MPNYFHSRIECGFHERQMKFFREQYELSRQEKEKISLKKILRKYFLQDIFVHILQQVQRNPTFQLLPKILRVQGPGTGGFDHQFLYREVCQI